MVIISLGTDATDLVISNGYRVWQRSIPLGGSHFTKAITKELKLTFAKAEHLKRNATAAADPKAVFQAMRPVFSDLLTELQRSFSYFSNLDRAAKIGRVIALGNAMKLPGLRRFLSQSLGFEIEKLESFRNLIGSQVVSAPSFQENLLSFPVAYGLALQGLAKGAVHTNLLPREITYDRLVKAQETLGRGRGRRAPVGLQHQFRRLFAGAEHGRRRAVGNRPRPRPTNSSTTPSSSSPTPSKPAPNSTAPVRSGRTSSETWKGASAGWNC